MPRQRHGQLLQGLAILVRTDLYRHLLVAPPMGTRRPTDRSKALLEDFANDRFGSLADTQRLENFQIAEFGARDASVSVRFRPKADTQALILSVCFIANRYAISLGS